MLLLRPIRARTALAVLAAAALLGACGSDDAPSTTGAGAAATTERGGAAVSTTATGPRSTGDDPSAPSYSGADDRPFPGAAGAGTRPESGGDRPAAAGDDSGASKTTSTPAAAAEPSGPTKASFVAFADGVCARFRADVAELDRGERAKEPAYRARRLSDLFDTAVQQLTTEPRPRNDRAALRSYLLRLVDQRALLRRLADAAERKDAVEVDAVRREVDDVAASARSRAQAYGLVVCGSA